MSLYASCVFKRLQRLEGVRLPGTGAQKVDLLLIWEELFLISL